MNGSMGINTFLKLIRAKNLLIIAATMTAVRYLLLYPLLDVYQIPFAWPWYYFALLVLSTMLIAAGGYVINNYVDMDIDEINNPEERIVGVYIDPEKAMSLYYGITFTGVIMGAVCAYTIDTLNLAFIQILTAGALYYYSTTFKFQGFLGNIVVALCCGLVPIVAAVYDLIELSKNYVDTINNLVISGESFAKLMEQLLRYAATYAIISFMITIIREIVKDAEDVEGDTEHDVRTLAVRFGLKTAAIIASGFTILLVGFVGYIAKLLFDAENYITFIYTVALIEVPLLIVMGRLIFAYEKVHFTRVSRLLKLIMVTGIGFLALIAAIHLL